MYQMEIIVQEAEGMSYLMMHTTHPLICTRQTDYPAHGFVVADSMWGWESFKCHPSDFMSSQACSFDMGVNSKPNRRKTLNMMIRVTTSLAKQKCSLMALL